MTGVFPPARLVFQVIGGLRLTCSEDEEEEEEDCECEDDHSREDEEEFSVLTYKVSMHTHCSHTHTHTHTHSTFLSLMSFWLSQVHVFRSVHDEVVMIHFYDCRHCYYYYYLPE